MIIKLLYLVIIYVLLNCSTNCLAARCQPRGRETAPTEVLEFDCREIPEFAWTSLSSFKRCGNKEVANENVTKVLIGGCNIDMFPTEAFHVFPNMTEFAIQLSYLELGHLSQEKFIGANHLENLSIRDGKFNIPASIFLHLPRLKAFQIKYSRVDFIDPQAFIGASALRTLVLDIIVTNATLCPKGIFDSFTDIQVLGLGCYVLVPGQGYYRNEFNVETLKVPANNKIKFLALLNGNITELNADMLVNLTSLTQLRLDSDGIQRIRPYTFVKLNDLIILEVRGNKIQELTQAMLAGLINLRVADFYLNEIRYIEREAFSGMLQLRRVDLSHNKISALESHMFHSLLKIRNIEFAYNTEVQIVDLNWFCNALNLSYLNLRGMGISTLKKSTQNSNRGEVASTDLSAEEAPLSIKETVELFSEWQYLTSELTLDGDIPSDRMMTVAFVNGMGHEKEYSDLIDGPQNISSVGGSTLAKLNLAGNQLSDWEENLFDTFVNLRVLILDGNPIESLRSGQFNGLGYLLILSLARCRLTSLDFNVFSPLTNLRQLYLQSNDLTTVIPPARTMNGLDLLVLRYENRFEHEPFTEEEFKKSFNLTKLKLY